MNDINADYRLQNKLKVIIISKTDIWTAIFKGNVYLNSPKDQTPAIRFSQLLTYSTMPNCRGWGGSQIQFLEEFQLHHLFNFTKLRFH